MPRNGRGCKAKGANFEREIASFINSTISGLNVRRALLSGGGRSDGGADLDDLPGIWAELKRVEKVNIHEAMAQATAGLSKSRAQGLVPAVFTRRSQQATPDSFVTMKLSDWLDLYARANGFVRATQGSKDGIEPQG